MVFAPVPMKPFQVKGDSSLWYLALVTKGCSLETSISKGKLNQPNTLFISDYFKTVIRDIITSALLLLASQVRCRFELDSIFIEEERFPLSYGVCTIELVPKFVRFDVQGEYQIDDLRVRTKLKTLLLEIMSRSRIGAGPEAEFDLFLKTFTDGRKNMDLKPNMKVYTTRLPTEWYYNVLFASKVERMELIERLYELFNGSEKYVVYCEETKDAFGKDWDKKLLSLYYRLMADESWKRDGSNNFIKKKDMSFWGENAEDVEMKRCIASIREMYRSFVNFEERHEEAELKRVDMLVELVHEIFPCHIAALARGASKMRWPLIMDFGRSTMHWPISCELTEGLRIDPILLI
ncbi:uncharacterized protein LOC120000881 [Tripterygium wilfordii]|uniref:uncharacterized protein LOC120000881 n=1 Tax=Tripterygium wilfordii TaxID=458696 RepID=UPI0018F7F6EF|nr:uncharacterized protein LOC120000881 [Tripterygium wilfordii]